MKKFSKFETAQIKTGSVFDQLPKGAYVIKISGTKVEANKSGEGEHIKIMFDIAEGEYKDFYKKQYEAMTGEDKHWPYDGVHNLPAPDDSSPQWMINSFGTFVAALEDSNEGYHWNWEEGTLKGKLVGAKFRNVQSEYNGKVYDHVKPKWFIKAQAVRDGKFGKLPNDVLIEKKPAADFVNVPEVGPEEIPF